VVWTAALAELDDDDEEEEDLDPVGVAVEVRLEELVELDLGAGSWKGGGVIEVETGLEPEVVDSSDLVDADPEAVAADVATRDTAEPDAVAVAEADTEADELTLEFEMSILSYEPVMSPYVYEVAPVEASSMVTLLTYMVKGAADQSVRPPAHSIVPAPSVEAPPSQLPILTTIGVWGKLAPPLASV